MESNDEDKILKMLKIDYGYRRIIGELYKHQTTSIRIKESKKEAAIRKGVMQVCNLSPLLFNIQGPPKKCMNTLTKENSTLYNRLL